MTWNDLLRKTIKPQLTFICSVSSLFSMCLFILLCSTATEVWSDPCGGLLLLITLYGGLCTISCNLWLHKTVTVVIRDGSVQHVHNCGDRVPFEGGRTFDSFCTVLWIPFTGVFEWAPVTVCAKDISKKLKESRSAQFLAKQFRSMTAERHLFQVEQTFYIDLTVTKRSRQGWFTPLCKRHLCKLFRPFFLSVW